MGGEAQSDICIKIPSMKKIDYCYIGFRQLFTFGGRYHQSLFQFIFDGNQELDFVNLSKSAFHNRNFQLLQFGIIKNNIGNIRLNTGDIIFITDIICKKLEERFRIFKKSHSM